MRNLESGKFLLVESKIAENFLEARALESRIELNQVLRNPTKTWNQNPRSTEKDWNQAPGIHNPWNEIQNPRLSCIP